MSYKNILVMTDFSIFSKEAVRQAAYLAKVSGCPLSVLHVAHDKSQFQVYITDEQYTNIRKKIDEEIEEKFSLLESEIEALKDVEWSSIIRRGTPYIEGIIEAEKGVYDLMVVGSYGESGLKKFAHGSTTTKIQNNCPINLLVTRLK